MSRSAYLALLLMSSTRGAASTTRGSAASAPPSDAFLVGCAEGAAECADVMRSPAPPLFDVLVDSTRGPFTVRVVTSLAPAMATRFWVLSRLAYAAGGPLYRVLRVNETQRFVAQWGYRASPTVDAAWMALQLSNETAAVAPPGNVRGSVAFGTFEVPGPLPPNCTSSQCSRGFSVELFVNLCDNTRELDAADFSPFGRVDEDDMARVFDTAWAGYGECSDLCTQLPAPASDPYCVPAPGGGWEGVNLTRMLDTSGAGGRAYLRRDYPKLDWITGVGVVIP